MATTKQQVTIKGVEGVQDQAPTNNDFVTVWCALRAPLTLTYPAARYNHSKEQGARHHTLTYTLKPGANRVPRQIWDHNAKKSTIVKRIDQRDLVVSAVQPKDMDRKFEAIAHGAPPEKAGSISDLCPAADKVTMKASMKQVGAPHDLHDIDAPEAIRLED